MAKRMKRSFHIVIRMIKKIKLQSMIKENYLRHIRLGRNSQR